MPATVPISTSGLASCLAPSTSSLHPRRAPWPLPPCASRAPSARPPARPSTSTAFPTAFTYGDEPREGEHGGPLWDSKPKLTRGFGGQEIPRERVEKATLDEVDCGLLLSYEGKTVPERDWGKIPVSFKFVPFRAYSPEGAPGQRKGECSFGLVVWGWRARGG